VGGSPSSGPDGGRVLTIYPGDSAGWFTGADDHTARGVESLGPLDARDPTNWAANRRARPTKC
jgi:hypothetical protein